jgi:hypothetical protein
MPAPTRAKVKILDSDAVKRIIKETALKTVTVKEGDLLQDLQGLNIKYAVATSDPKPREEQASAIAQHANKLQGLLKMCDTSLNQHLWFECDTLSRHGLLTGLNELEHAAKSLPKLQSSDLRKLIYQELSKIYQDHFKRPPGRSGGAQPGGPYVRFVEAVGREYGIPISNHTVHAYLKPRR